MYKNKTLKALEIENQKLSIETHQQKILYEKIKNKMELTIHDHALYKKRTVTQYIFLTILYKL